MAKRSPVEIANEAAEIAEALCRVEKARTETAFYRVRRKLVWLYCLGGVIAAALGLPAVTSFIRFLLTAAR
jgi:hypothetical protein